MPFTVLGGNAPLLKRQNRAAVLRAILSFGPLSRRALCRRTGLTASTMTNIIAELAEAGLAREVGVVETPEGAPRAGRREVLVDLDPLGGVVLGGHIGMQRVALAVGDLRAGILSSARFSTDAGRGPAATVMRVAAEIPGLLERAGVRRERVLGIGMGVVGPVEPETGVLGASPELGWHDAPLRESLQLATGLPTVLDSGRRGMALAEMMFGLGQDVSNFMLVHIGSTLVAGIVADRQLYRGATGCGGSIGHLSVPGVLARCRCGRTGCLDAVASEAAMEERAAEIARHAPDSALARAMADESEELGRHRLYAAARIGDPLALQVLHDAARHLGRAVANILSVLDMELILIGGEAVVACPSFVDVAREVIHAEAARASGSVSRVLPSGFGMDTRLYGGLALALHDLFYAPALTLAATAGRRSVAAV
ncbi:MAG: ROK family transcriptional regulator [Chloroflexi bacterium]|nr:ROK family transcriptional regulator [Chloroflexota bacterium]